MKIIQINNQTKLVVTNIKGFIKRKVTKFGTSAKVDCPKEYLGQEVYLVILENESRRRNKTTEKRIRRP